MNLQWAKHPLSRRLRSRGFGVHSPFAFEFIRQVLAQPCAYYCYARIASLAVSRRDAATSRLLFRVALRFRPACVSLQPGISLSPAMIAALEAAMPSATIVTGKAPFMICAGPFQGTPEPGAVLFSTLPYSDPVAHCAPAFGMSFNGSSGSVYVGLPHLPRQAFELTD